MQTDSKALLSAFVWIQSRHFLTRDIEPWTVWNGHFRGRTNEAIAITSSRQGTYGMHCASTHTHTLPHEWSALFALRLGEGAPAKGGRFSEAAAAEWLPTARNLWHSGVGRRP